MESSKKIYNLQSLKDTLSHSIRVGLFGGSFNPAHVGHLEISKYGLSVLNLDYVIWLVAEQNPLKVKYNTSFEDRCIHASEFIDDNKILVSNVESEIKSQNSFSTIEFFCDSFPSIRFTWMMGADCLKDFHLWENYNHFTDLVDLAIFDRPGYSVYMEDGDNIKELLKNPSHRVIFCKDKMIDVSSTEIRRKLGD